MSVSQKGQAILDSVAPRFLVGNMEQALAFYEQLGFAARYHDEGFAIVGRDRITLQFNVSDPTREPPQEGCRVCYVGVTNIEALYQQYVPTGALRSPIQVTDWGTKSFWLCDPFRNILIFEESIPTGGRSLAGSVMR
jgi:catechol 2,3-dioxygenase-like lactoylglutathione lyase family enzyme